MQLSWRYMNNKISSFHSHPHNRQCVDLFKTWYHLVFSQVQVCLLLQSYDIYTVISNDTYCNIPSLPLKNNFLFCLIVNSPYCIGLLGCIDDDNFAYMIVVMPCYGKMWQCPVSSTFSMHESSNKGNTQIGFSASWSLCLQLLWHKLRFNAAHLLLNELTHWY